MTSAMSNEEIVELIQAGTNVKENLALLYKQNLGFIVRMARRYANGSVSENDLTQEAYFAIELAARKYSPDFNCKFLTYAAWYIRQKIQRHAGDNVGVIRLPVHLQQQVRQLNRYLDDYYKDNLEEPTFEQIMEALCLDKEQLQNLMKCSKQQKVLSLEYQLSSDDESMDLLNVIPDDINIELDAINVFTMEEIRTFLWDEIDKLDADESYLVRAVFKDKKQIKKVAAELNVTQQSVSYKLKKILERLAYNEVIQGLMATYRNVARKEKTVRQERTPMAPTPEMVRLDQMMNELSQSIFEGISII